MTGQRRSRLRKYSQLDRLTLKVNGNRNNRSVNTPMLERLRSKRAEYLPHDYIFVNGRIERMLDLQPAGKLNSGVHLQSRGFL